MYLLQSFGCTVLCDSQTGRILHLRSRKHLGLLLYLRSHSTRPHDRHSLSRLFWDTEVTLARHSLSQAIYDLRRRLPALDFQSRGGMLAMTGRDYLAFDGHALERAIKSRKLSEACDLYRGEFAPNLQGTCTDAFDRWLEEERSRYRTLGQTALRQYLLDSEHCGQWGDMCLAALRLLKLDQFDESAHSALMKALWMQGDPHSALQHFATIQKIFSDDPVQPVPSSAREMANRIRSSMRQTSTDPSLSTSAQESRLPLIGRGPEYEMLRRLICGVQDCPLRLVVLRGEAGIGKTRLLEELTTALPLETVTFVKSGCYHPESELAYSPVVDGICSIGNSVSATGSVEGTALRLPQLVDPTPVSETPSPATIDTGAQRRRLFDEVADFLNAVNLRTPLIWILEDVQWIDASSAALLHYICRRLQDRPILIVMTVTSDVILEAGAVGLLNKWAANSDITYLKLSPLSTAATRTLCETAAPSLKGTEGPSIAVRYAGGNPFFALELLKGFGRGKSARPKKAVITKRLAAVLEARLEGLSDGALRVLDAVSVLEELATPRLVAQLCCLTFLELAVAFRELKPRSLIRDSGSRVAFGHQITREFVYHSLGDLPRAALHLAAGEVLAGEGDVSSAVIARHFEKGGDAARAHDYAMRGAEEAQSAREHGKVAALATLAARTAGDNQQKAEAYRLLAAARLSSGQFREAAEHLRTVLAFSTSAKPELRSEAYLELARAEVECCAWRNASLALKEMTPTLVSVRDRRKKAAMRLEQLYESIRLAVCLQDRQKANAYYRQLRRRYAQYEKRGVLSREASTTAILGQAFYATFLDTNAVALQLLETLPCKENIEPSLEQRIQHVRGVINARRGAWNEAKASFAKGLSVANSANDVGGVAGFTNNLACISLERGDWLETEALCDRSEELYKSLGVGGPPVVPVLLNRANAAFYQGNARLALRQYSKIQDSYVEPRPKSSDVWFVDLYMSLGLIAAQLGDRQASYHYLTNAHETGVTEPLIMQERFKYEWLRAFHLYSAEQSDVISARLSASASEECNRDSVSAAKLMWLSAMFRRPREEALLDEAYTQLQQLGIPWFRGFARRWFRLAVEEPETSRPKLVARVPPLHAPRHFSRRRRDK